MTLHIQNERLREINVYSFSTAFRNDILTGGVIIFYFN
jgi:hypothetical protein